MVPGTASEIAGWFVEALCAEIAELERNAGCNALALLWPGQACVVCEVGFFRANYLYTHGRSLRPSE
jgi:hypothetical protein